MDDIEKEELSRQVKELDECNPEFWRQRIKEAPDFYFPEYFTQKKKDNLAINLASWNTHSPYGALYVHEPHFDGASTVDRLLHIIEHPGLAVERFIKKHES